MKNLGLDMPIEIECFITSGNSCAIDSTVHSVIGSCLSLCRTTVHGNFLHEDEKGCDSHKDLQTDSQQRLPNLQTAHYSELLSCKTLQQSQVFGSRSMKNNIFLNAISILPKHRPELLCHRV